MQRQNSRNYDQAGQPTLFKRSSTRSISKANDGLLQGRPNITEAFWGSPGDPGEVPEPVTRGASFFMQGKGNNGIPAF